MPEISFKEFMDQVKEQLEGYSVEILRDILYEWARDTHPNERVIFLQKIRPPPVKVKSFTDDELLEDIDDLMERVEDGSFCNGWGWDDEIQDSRDWGDESWVEEVDDFFSRAKNSIMNGDYKVARDAYSKIFDILDMAEEPGHLPGQDPWEMVKNDLDEVRALYFRAIYLSTPLINRPQELFEGMQRFNYYKVDEDLNMKNIINVLLKPLPDFDSFLSAWIDFLKKSKGAFASHLLREAVMIKEGIQGIKSLAINEGKYHPRSYLDWIAILEEKGDYQGMIEAARKGINEIPEEYTIRSEIAKGLARAGKMIDDLEVQLEGLHYSFISNPSLLQLIYLIPIAKRLGRYEDEINIAIERVNYLLQKDKESISVKPLQIRYREDKASATITLLCQIYLLDGKFKEAFNLCQKEGFLGWSGLRNPKAIIVPFFLKILKKKGFQSPNLEFLWNWVVENACLYDISKHDIDKEYKRIMNDVFSSVHLPNTEAERYLQLCSKEVKNRVNAIVENQYRNSYKKAANLIAALSEVISSRMGKTEGNIIIDTYKNKFPRHRAFQQELNKAISLN